MGIASMTLKPHGISRAEWVRRFYEEFKKFIDDVDEDLILAELESWPERDPKSTGDEDWLTDLPEDAAQENLSYWGEE
jgi:hypothetical protein